MTDLQATRSGNAVQVEFTVPTLSTDGQPLRTHELHGILCRQESHAAPCEPVDTRQTAQVLVIPDRGPAVPVLWTDNLPARLLQGAPRPIAYRMELLLPSGASAGFSDPVYTAAGAAPPPVASFRASGNRLGIELSWDPVPGAGEVLLQRTASSPSPSPTDTNPISPTVPAHNAGTDKSGRGRRSPASRRESGPSTPGTVWLQAEPGSTSAAATLDNSIEPGVTYRYSALRRLTVKVGGHPLELSSQLSAPEDITWQNIYPPPAPTGLTALGYEVPATGSQPPSYAVDLVWLPVVDKQLAGYIVSRQELGREGIANGKESRLTAQPVPVPGFHDAAALPGRRYRYSVSAIAANGRESPAVETDVPPQ